MIRKKSIFGVHIMLLLVTIFLWQWPVAVDADFTPAAVEEFLPAPLEPQLSSDEKTLDFGQPLIVFINDPNPPEALRRIPAPAWIRDLPDDAATATFSISYVPDGGTDPWGERCYTFPSAAKTAFNAAAQVWGNILMSSVPVTIRACWADLGSSSILGYSGGAPFHRDFAGATKANTWYAGSLANALYGSDLNSSAFDMHITYNRNFSWYYGTDGNPPITQHDFMTVVMHEIGHGLNFSGSMSYSGGIGSWGYGTAYPNIYDTFVKDGTGKFLTSYVNGSTALGNALTSNSIWFHGPWAMAANGGPRVKLYAPSTWRPGSSYSHLDYDTFNNTLNQLMVFAISAGESIHNPGPVTKGLLRDLGWPVPSTPDPDPDPGPSPSVSLPFLTPLLLDKNPSGSCFSIANGNFDSGAATWKEYSSNGYTLIGKWGVSRSGKWSTWLGGALNETAYIQQSVSIGAACPYLIFYHWIASEDSCGNDKGYVRINGKNVATIKLCSSEATGGWKKKSINLKSYANKTVKLQFRAVTNSSRNSNWFIDDVSLQASASAGSVAEPLPAQVESATQKMMEEVPLKGR